MHIEVFSDFVLKHAKIDVILIASTGDTDGIAEVIDGFSRVASPAHAVDGKYSGIVPALDPIGEDEFVQFALGEDGVGDVQSGVLPDMRPVDVQSFEDPVVEFSSNFELQRAERVGDPFETVADGVGVVVERVNAPLVAHVGMRVEFNSVDDRIAQSCVDMLVVDLSAKRVRAFLVEAQSHFLE